MSIYLVLSALSIASGVWGHPAPHHPAPRQVPVSNQYIHVTDNFDKCLAASSDANGATVRIEDCSIGGDTRQSWTVSGSTLQVFSNMCLDVTNGAIANGTPLQIWECAASNTNQEWTLSGSTIQWSGEDSCLDLTNGNVTDGNVVQIWGCSHGPNQRWTLTTGASETITHWTSNTTCLTAPTNANGGEVVVAPCDGSASQLWTEIGPTIVVYGNMCLDVPNGNTTDGVKLQIWACTPGVGDANQQFFYLTSDQNIQWINEHKCLDLPDGNLASGTQIQMYACFQDPIQTNQVWNFG
ncbi:ricin B lectin domain-containing protein [Mycena alexandri]|uniref:Ricin B lectin domain-containing protein n=1 Tax=Mycena alexandri TaxID=1745969 RepID=A0AAD6SWK9_9AGAR|nr:ricin B lectin domain-containing protein [Mycena alexandri]